MRVWLASRWLIAALVGVGIVLRVVRYAADRSLWGDEGALALNILDRSGRELLEPLHYRQGAPTGFLEAEKLATRLFDQSELSLRLVPLLSGIATLVLLAAVARRLLGPGAAAMAVALCVFSGPLVYYSSEVKQYSTDVFVATLLLYGALRIPWERLSLRKGVGLAAAGAILVWFSHPALLVLPALVIVLLTSAYFGRDRRAMRSVGLLGAIWFVSGLVAYATNRANTASVAGAALKSFGTESSGVRGLPGRLWDAYPDVVGVAATTTGLAAIMALAGFVTLWEQSTRDAALVTAPCVVTLAAAAVGRYPVSGRFLLFLAPPLIILAAAGTARVVQALPRSLAAVGLAGAALLLAYPVGTSVSDAIDPPGHEEVKTVLRGIDRNWRSGDALFVWWQSQYPFRYYAECDDCDVLSRTGPAATVWPRNPGGLPDDYALETHPPSLYVSKPSRGLASYLEEIARLQGRPRVWLLFSSTWDDAFVKQMLDCAGQQLDEFRAPRAVAYLYDLQSAPASRACRL